jgi:hypothetical protein
MCGSHEDTGKEQRSENADYENHGCRNQAPLHPSALNEDIRENQTDGSDYAYEWTNHRPVRRNKSGRHRQAVLKALVNWSERESSKAKPAEHDKEHRCDDP